VCVRYASPTIAHCLMNMPCKPAPETGREVPKNNDKTTK
jgi:hypothetical protein